MTNCWLTDDGAVPRIAPSPGSPVVNGCVGGCGRGGGGLGGGTTPKTCARIISAPPFPF